MTNPYLPYGGGEPNSGWSGSTASQARALSEDKNGTTFNRQMIVWGLLDHVGTFGITWKELCDKMGWHHGQSSSVLSVLHKAEKISRLTETRNKCSVYVLPRFVHGRATSPHGRTSTSKKSEQQLRNQIADEVLNYFQQHECKTNPIDCDNPICLIGMSVVQTFVDLIKQNNVES